MQITVQIEFLLSGVITIVGFAALLESIKHDAVLGLLRELFVNPQIKLPQGAAIPVGTIFLGGSYFVGVLVTVSVYDIFVRPRMTTIIKRYLQRDPDLASQVQSLPNYRVCQGDTDDVYEAVYAFADVNGREAVHSRRSFETSLQRLARGVLPGLVLLLLATVISVDWARFWQDALHGLIVTWPVLLIALLVYLAVSQMIRSTRDEARYLAEILALLQKPKPADSLGAPAGPESNA